MALRLGGKRVMPAAADLGALDASKAVGRCANAYQVGGIDRSSGSSVSAECFGQMQVSQFGR